MKKFDYFLSVDGICLLLHKLSVRKNRLVYKCFSTKLFGIPSKCNFSDVNLPQINDCPFQYEWNHQLVATAERYLNGIYDILGSGDIHIEKIDWSKDYKSGHKWQQGKFYRDYIQESIETDSDVKWPREISRCHQLLQCAVAFDATKDKRYAVFVVDQITDFIENNPLMRSINWGCTMDVSIRAVNWLWSLAIIRKSYKIDNDKWNIIVRSLYEHGWFIYRNPEKGMVYNHNHYLADLSGQIQLGLMFRDTKEGQKWLSEGENELFREIRCQILPSGMSYERSTHYNRLVLELVLVPVLLLKSNGYEIPQDIWCRIESMFEFISGIIQPDGEVPIIGDQDNGRLLPFSVGELNDFRYLMSLGAMLFGRSDFKRLGNGYNVYCRYLCGNVDVSDYNAIPDIDFSPDSKAYPDAGFYVMRKDEDYLIFNASGKGLYPELSSTTHTHSDLLSINLSANGEPFLIDPGTFVYTANAGERALFRSTEMHNTATVDGQSQNIIDKSNLWDFERNAIPSVSVWMSDDKHDIIEASHNGYTRLSDPVIHTRRVSFDKKKHRWDIEDIFDANAEHDYKIHFHTAKEISVINNDGYVILKGKDTSLKFSFVTESQYDIVEYDTFLSRSYGSKEQSKEFIISIHENKSFKIITSIEKL